VKSLGSCIAGGTVFWCNDTTAIVVGCSKWYEIETVVLQQSEDKCLSVMLVFSRQINRKMLYGGGATCSIRWGMEREISPRRYKNTEVISILGRERSIEMHFRMNWNEGYETRRKKSDH
jgi:hypothetical protein